MNTTELINHTSFFPPDTSVTREELNGIHWRSEEKFAQSIDGQEKTNGTKSSDEKKQHSFRGRRLEEVTTTAFGRGTGRGRRRRTRARRKPIDSRNTLRHG